MRKRWLSVGVLIVAITTMFGLEILEEKMLFPAPPLSQNWLSKQAQEQGAEELRLTTEDRVRLYGWHLKAAKERRGVVIWFDGNGASVGQRPREFGKLRNEGWDVVQINYRGYPGSEGRPSEEGLRKDARAVYDFAVAVDPRVAAVGKSLGGGVAVGLAAEHSLQWLVLESTFASAQRVATELWGWPVEHLIRNRFDSLKLAAKVKCRSLVLHGEQDPLIRISQAEDLSRALGAPLRRVSGGHNDPLMLEHWEEVMAWIEKVEAGKARAR
jgi:uncharacterized protein